MNDPKAYTAKQLRINLLLAQQHADDLVSGGEDSNAANEFCAECLEKHLLLIEGLAQEALSFFEGKDFFSEMAAWAAETQAQLNGMGPGLAQEVSATAREYRKKLTALTSECEPCKRLAERFAQQLERPGPVMRGSAV